MKFENESVLSVSNNGKKLWQLINSKVNKKQKKFSKINRIVVDNKKITDDLEIAKEFNEFFSKIGKTLSDKIDPPPNTELTLPDSNSETIYLQPVNYFKVEKIIQKMKVKKGGVDNINTKVLKAIYIYIADALFYISNLSIHLGVWPDALKKADIVPIHKSGKKDTLNNYRPISLISNIAKILEKLIYNRLYKFLMDNKIISEKQFGFLRKIGTREALYNVSQMLYSNLEKSQPVIASFLDLAKAFDTVDHNILMLKLYQMGIRGKAYELIASYLSNRKQAVKINGHKSEYIEMSMGVPQGSILGPLLFLLYYNDIIEKMPKDSVLCYADDTVILTQAKSWKEAAIKMNQLLNKIATLLAINKLSLNKEKTFFITFGNYADSVPKKIVLKIKETEIKRVKSVRYLGVILDYRLNWSNHTEYVRNKIKYLLYVFYKLKQTTSIFVMRIIYYAFFHSIVSYGIIAWGGAYNNNINQLQSLQNRILKLVNKNTFEIDKMPCNIRQLFTLESLVYHYESLKNIFINSTSITRNKSIKLPSSCMSVSNKMSSIEAIRTFNSLPNEMKVLQESKKRVKKQLKGWIMHNI